MVVQEAAADVVRLHVGVLDVNSDGTLDGPAEVRINGKAVAWETLRIIMNRGERTRIILAWTRRERGDRWLAPHRSSGKKSPPLCGRIWRSWPNC